MNASELIDRRIAELAGDWRGPVLARLQDLINAADSELTEDCKWETAVWTRGGLVRGVGAFKDAVASTSSPAPPYLTRTGCSTPA